MAVVKSPGISKLLKSIYVESQRSNVKGCQSTLRPWTFDFRRRRDAITDGGIRVTAEPVSRSQARVACDSLPSVDPNQLKHAERL